MGFPVGYSELPSLFLHVMFLLGHVRRVITWSLDAAGIGELLDSDTVTWPDQSVGCPSVPAALVDEALPVVRFHGVLGLPDSCAVCLHEIEDGVEVRQLTNCRHVFHRWCLDPWIGHRQLTCPLCRSPLFGEEATADALAVASYDDGYYYYPSSYPNGS